MKLSYFWFSVFTLVIPIGYSAKADTIKDLEQFAEFPDGSVRNLGAMAGSGELWLAPSDEDKPGLSVNATQPLAAVGESSVCLWHGNSSAAFTPTYDDMPGSGWFSLKGGFEPLHEEFKLKGSVAIVPHASWTNGTWFPNGFGWPDLKAILDKGWLEPISHTFTHPHLPTLTSQQIAEEFMAASDAIRVNTGYTVQSLAYSYGDYDAHVNSEAKKYFVSARAFDNAHNDPNSMDYYGIHSLAIVSTTTQAEIDRWMTDAIKNHEWLVTTSHSIKEFQDGWEPAPLEIYRYELTKASEKITSGEIWNDTYSQVAKYIKERQATHLRLISASTHQVLLSLTMDAPLDPKIYDVPLTLKTEIPAGWRDVRVKQASNWTVARLVTSDQKHFALFDVKPRAGRLEVFGH